MSLPDLMKGLVKQYNDIKTGNARYGVAVVSLVGKEGLDICGYDTEPRHIACAGDILRFRTNCKSLAAIVERALDKTSERQVLLWENIGSNGPVAGIIPPPEGRGWSREMHSLTIDQNRVCYVGTRKGDTGVIARYEKKTNAKGKPELQVTAKIKCEFAPSAIAWSQDGLYCASRGKIYCIDKALSSMREFAAFNLPKGVGIHDIDFSCDQKNSVLSVLTKEVKEVSQAHIWVNGEYQQPKPVSHYAFAATAAYGRILFFNGNKNEISMAESGGQQQRISIAKDLDIQLLRFDPKMNYLYSITSQQVKSIPFYPKEYKLLTDFKFPEPVVFPQKDSISDARVGELWS